MTTIKFLVFTSTDSIEPDRFIYFEEGLRYTFDNGVNVTGDGSRSLRVELVVDAVDKVAAWTLANDLLNTTIRALSLKLGIPLREIDEYGVFVEAVSEANSKSGPHFVAALSPLINGGSTKISSSEFESRLSQISLQGLQELYGSNEELKYVLKMCSSYPHEWGNLYKILEAIESDMGGVPKIVATGWASANQISLFKRTASSRVAAGETARHGRDRAEPPPNPMSLENGRELIMSIMNQWIDLKFQQAQK